MRDGLQMSGQQFQVQAIDGELIASCVELRDLRNEYSRAGPCLGLVELVHNNKPDEQNDK